MSNKDYLYSTIFKLFLSKNYKLVTVADMEKATGLTRGAIFHYAQDKQSLFREIVDTYFFQSKAIDEEMKQLADEKVKNLSLKDFIHLFVQLVDKRLQHLEELLNLSRPEAARSYMNFLMQSQDYYPNFIERLNELCEKEVAVWETIVTNAQKNGEITPRIDPKIYAHTFGHYFMGFYFQSSFSNKTMDAETIENYLMSLYKMIQK